MTERGPASSRHVPVMLPRILDLLAPALERPGAVYLDGTLGMGGHAEGVLTRFPEALVVGVDRDPEALALAGARLSRFGGRFQPVHAVYDEVAAALDGLGHDTFDAALFDLGVSSLQIDEPDRGFAYRLDAPLDMRMDQSRGQTAADVLAGYSHGDLARVLRVYGEERYASRIATLVIAQRETAPVTTTGQLVELLRAAIPAASQRQSGHPAKRTFQALRIEVNDELRVWERAVEAALECTAVGGRLAVLSYHSLEDRITKTAFRAASSSSAPAGLPVELPEHAARFRLITRRGEEPTAGEVEANPRAASAHLRVVERVRPGGRAAEQSGTRRRTHRAPTDGTSTGRTSTGRTSTDHTSTGRTSTDRTSTDRTSTRTQGETR